jgi:hypothetical protein
MVVIIIKYIKSEDFIMNPLVAAASVIAAGLSVGLAAMDLGWDKELLLVMLWKVLLDNPRLSKIGPFSGDANENRVNCGKPSYINQNLSIMAMQPSRKYTFEGSETTGGEVFLITSVSSRDLLPLPSFRSVFCPRASKGQTDEKKAEEQKVKLRL